MMRRAFALITLSGLAIAGCGSDRDQSITTTSPGPTRALDLSYADVADDYAKVSGDALTRGRDVVDRLIAGDIASVYEQTIPEIKAKVSLADLEREFAEEQARAPIGTRLEERVILLGAMTVYYADHARGEGRLRFQISFDPSGVNPLVTPVQPLPPDPRADQPAKARLRLPFDGLWWAAVAPTPEIGNHHAAATDQRHAFDFVVWRDGSTYGGDGRDNADYWAWEQPVLAPAGGRVVAVQDGIADNRPGVETNTADPAGNHVVIDLGHGEYAALAHFKKGSIRVAKGDEVTSGQVLGITGNSGNSSEPHIHFHVQDAPTFKPGGSVGIPVRFESYEADGTPQTLGTPSGGQFIRQLESTTGTTGNG